MRINAGLEEYLVRRKGEEEEEGRCTVGREGEGESWEFRTEKKSEGGGGDGGGGGGDGGGGVKSSSLSVACQVLLSLPFASRPHRRGRRCSGSLFCPLPRELLF